MFAFLTTEITCPIYLAVQEAAAGRILVNVVGFSMGNSWIAPDVQTMSYGPMFYQLVSNMIMIRSGHERSVKCFIKNTVTLRKPSMSVLLIVGPKRTFAVSHAVPW